MSHIDGVTQTFNPKWGQVSVHPNTSEPLVLVIEGDSEISRQIRGICEFLEFEIERVDTRDDLLTLLHDRRPMAIITELDLPEQDGCFVLMTVAAHNRDLPVLMLTGKDSAMMGAVDAVEEVWGLSGVVKASALPSVGEIVDFLFRAGRRSGVSRLVPV